MAHPDILNLYWEDIAKIILANFYESVGKPKPVWIDRLVEQDQIEAHEEEGKLQLRAFFVRKINDEYNSYIRTLSTKDDIILANGVVERFDFCIKHDLVTCLAPHNNGAETVETSDVFDDLRKIKIESLTSLKDLASMIGGKFESCSRINGVKIKVAAGPTTDFKSFLKREVQND